VKVKVNTLMYGQWALATGLSSLLAYCIIIAYRKLLRFITLRVQLVVSVSAFVMVRTVWSVSCFFVLLYSRCSPCSVTWAAPRFLS